MDLVFPAEHGLLTAGGLPVAESDTQLAHTRGVNPSVETVFNWHTFGSKIFLFKLPLLIQNLRRLVKRRRALLESNSPRNNQPETDRNRWSEERSAGRSLLLNLRAATPAHHWIDSPPHA